jgi:hypothetical protein
MKQNKDAFVKVPLWWIREATKAMETPMALVAIELLYARWKTKSLTFPLPNGRLTKLGINRKTKQRALRRLEAAGLITVEQVPRKTPRVTLTIL